MQNSIAKKKQAFHKSIRTQNLNRLLGLKRIKPRPVQSTQSALMIIQHGAEKLNYSQDQFQLVEALKSIRLCLSKYLFKNSPHLITQIKNYVTWTVKQKVSDTLKVACAQVICILCFHYYSFLRFEDIPLNYLDQYNLTLVRLVLQSISHLVANIPINQNLRVTYFQQANILKHLLQVRLNLKDNRQQFEQIKIPYLICCITISFLAFKWGLSIKQNDICQVLNFSLQQLQKDIIRAAQQDPQLKIYFADQNQKLEIDSQKFSQYSLKASYPFSLLRIQLEIFKQFNIDVVQKLQECLAYQLKNQNVQNKLVQYLLKCFFETTAVFNNEEIKEMVFAHIFYADNLKKEDNAVQGLIILCINHSINNNQPDYSIFKYTGDNHHKQYPKSIHLLEVIQVLENQQDFLTQQKLFQLLQNYMTINGDASFYNQCKMEIARYKQGVKALKRIYLDVQLCEGCQNDFNGQERLDENEWKEIMELENGY